MQNKPKKNQNINFLFLTIHLAFSWRWYKGVDAMWQKASQ
jgi:hypothetical protein